MTVKAARARKLKQHMGPTTSKDEWGWVFSSRAEDQLAQLPADT